MPPLPSDQPRKRQAGSLISGHSWVISFRRGRAQRGGRLRGHDSVPGDVPATGGPPARPHLWLLLGPLVSAEIPSLSCVCPGTQPPVLTTHTRASALSTPVPAGTREEKRWRLQGFWGQAGKDTHLSCPLSAGESPSRVLGRHEARPRGKERGWVKTRNFLTAPGCVL